MTVNAKDRDKIVISTDEIVISDSGSLSHKTEDKGVSCRYFNLRYAFQCRNNFRGVHLSAKNNS